MSVDKGMLQTFKSYNVSAESFGHLKLQKKSRNLYQILKSPIHQILEMILLYLGLLLSMMMKLDMIGVGMSNMILKKMTEK